MPYTIVVGAFSGFLVPLSLTCGRPNLDEAPTVRSLRGRHQKGEYSSFLRVWEVGELVLG